MRRFGDSFTDQPDQFRTEDAARSSVCPFLPAMDGRACLCQASACMAWRFVVPNNDAKPAKSSAPKKGKAAATEENSALTAAETVSRGYCARVSNDGY